MFKSDQWLVKRVGELNTWGFSVLTREELDSIYSQILMEYACREGRASAHHLEEYNND